MDNPILSARSALLVVGAFFTVCSLSLAPLMEICSPLNNSLILVSACLGAIGAAPALLAIGAVLGVGPYWLRIPLCFGAGLLLFGWGLIGGVVASLGQVYSLSTPEWRELVSVLLCLPLVFLVVQLPLWLVRLFFHWELVVPSPSGELAKVPSSTIRGMLVAMVFIGLSLAGTRCTEQLLMRDDPMIDPEFWVGMGIILAFCSGISLVSTLPILVATLRSRTVARARVGVGIYTAIWLAILLTFIWMSASPFGPLEIAFMSTMVVTFAAALAVPLLMARRLGFRLQWGRETTSRLKPTD